MGAENRTSAEIPANSETATSTRQDVNQLISSSINFIKKVCVPNCLKGNNHCIYTGSLLQLEKSHDHESVSILPGSCVLKSDMIQFLSPY